MSACSKLALSSSLNMVMDQEAKVPQKQGIVSILTPDSERSARSVASLRRTLSADMSSKKWLSQNGFISVCPLKKIASSKEFSRCISEYSSSTDGDEEDENYEDHQVKNQDKEKPAELDIWSLIVSQSRNKDQEQDKSAAPYIHPMLKRSASALSKKSLEVCTESLGSETGSDDFSSRTSHKEEEQPPQQQHQHQHQQQSSDYEDVKVVKYNFAAVGKKLPPPSFPPPLPSLPSRRDGASLQVKPRRENGRLVLEAVSVSAQNNLKAERQDGRLVLTFVNASSPQEEAKNEQVIQEEKEEGVLDQSSDDKEHDYEDEGTEGEDEEEEERTRGREFEIMMEQEPKMSSGVIKLHRLALMMNKSASLAAMNNPTCPHKLNQMVKFQEEATLLGQALPPVGHLVGSAPAASFNAYDYCWRAKPTAAQAMEKNSNNKYVISKNNSSIIADKNQHLQEMVMMKGIKADYNYIVPNLKGCKEHRIRSLFWEPYCVAMS